MAFKFITYFLFLFGVSIFFSSSFCRASDTISAGQSLFPNQTIISKEGKFELGFFSPGTSTNFYIGIWYKNIPVTTVVWVLNRNHPIPQSLYYNSQLEVANGTLLLRSGLNMIFSYKQTNNATEAVILDTGNFIIRNASGVQWQSFEHPTDTWLPGAKLGYRWFSDINVKLVSWRNPNDPASGSFSLGMGSDGNSDLSIRKGNGTLWSSGPWQGGTFQSLDLNYPYNFTYLARDLDVYVTYNNKSVLSRILINHRGRMELFQWLEVRRAWDLFMVKPYSCGAYAMCGPNTMCDTDPSPACRCLSGFKPLVEVDWDSSDFSSGCVRRRPFHCTDKVGYIKVTTSRLPESQESVELPNNVCELQCSKTCSCTAYAYGSGGKCILLEGDFLDLETPTNNSAGVDLHVKVKQKGNRKVLLLELVLPIPAALLLLSCFGFCYVGPKLINRKSKDTHQNLLLLDLDSNGAEYKKVVQVGNTHGEDKNDKYELPIFSFSSIVASTNNFSVENKLGEGGFGPVYKGLLLNGLFVAVKRLSKRSGQGLEEFKNETEVIAKLQHRNLVRILGCCIENNEMILVYEYMPNNSLDFFIFEPTSGVVLEWAKRVEIIEGIAQGLLYLHHYSRLRIVHRDLKASNILLDAEMNPKISDFGMARIFGGNSMQANTERIVGTYGYMSPEYAMEGLFSVKSDVFAFGVLMLEIISGKKNTGFYGSEYLSLLGYTWNAWIHGRALEVFDPSLEMAASSSAALRYIKIGLLCVQENPADRPLMSDVVGMLSNEDAEAPSPLNPAFTVTRSSNKVQICSVNGLTLSHVEAR
ncbi:hypothetical protein SASPL_152115 [Salvia splendens]|uniref:Receptor-like serine/threonine-protein kinase n=1 Tax=Salvia splendens TaxID=180675 RepID=A0A8X8W2P0_SALSN|nr:hypothetical protein SASPL_152115 [Salvia splendens]